MKSILCALIVATTALAHAQTNRVEGQIYIRTKGGTTYKLSSTSVFLVSPNQYQAAMKEWMSETLSISRAKENDAEWRKRIGNLVDAMPRMSANDRATAMGTYETLNSQLKTNYPVSQRTVKTQYVFLAGMDLQPAAHTVTDADGNFSMNAPAGAWVVLALAKRSVGDSEEKYLWAVPVPPEGRVFLNNGNLTEP